jgi:hypothetical protein
MSDVKPRPYNSADPEQVKRREKNSELRSHRDVSDVRYLLSTPQGRRFFHRLLAECQPFQSPAHPSGSSTYLNIGRMEVGQLIFRAMNQADPAAFNVMNREHEEDPLNV